VQRPGGPAPQRTQTIETDLLHTLAVIDHSRCAAIGAFYQHRIVFVGTFAIRVEYDPPAVAPVVLDGMKRNDLIACDCGRSRRAPRLESMSSLKEGVATLARMATSATTINNSISVNPACFICFPPWKPPFQHSAGVRRRKTTVRPAMDFPAALLPYSRNV
jgi:hypothetical protein